MIRVRALSGEWSGWKMILSEPLEDTTDGSTEFGEATCMDMLANKLHLPSK
jgi:hypothetical protein